MFFWPLWNKNVEFSCFFYGTLSFILKTYHCLTERPQRLRPAHTEYVVDGHTNPYKWHTEIFQFSTWAEVTFVIVQPDDKKEKTIVNPSHSFELTIFTRQWCVSSNRHMSPYIYVGFSTDTMNHGSKFWGEYTSFFKQDRPLSALYTAALINVP